MARPRRKKNVTLCMYYAVWLHFISNISYRFTSPTLKNKYACNSASDATLENGKTHCTSPVTALVSFNLWIEQFISQWQKTLRRQWLLSLAEAVLIHEPCGIDATATPCLSRDVHTTRSERKMSTYRKTSNISRTLVGGKIVDNSDVVGASPVGAAPTTSSFST